MSILNLTQHSATPAQLQAGVVEPEDKGAVQTLLTFEGLPSREQIHARALALAELANNAGCTDVMVGGAPYLMGPLEDALRGRRMNPIFAFSERKSVEKTDPETGEVKKNTVFIHLGFVGLD